MEERTVRSAGAEATLAWGAALAAALESAGCTGLVIDLRGELGAGKTVLVRGLGRALGVPERVPIVSPTFTIARGYGLPGPRLRELHHLDAYRLEGPDDLEAAGFEEMCGEGRLTCVEWGGNVRAALPEDRLHIHLAHALLEDAPPADGGESEEAHGLRRIVLRAGGPLAAAVLTQLRAPEDATPA